MSKNNPLYAGTIMESMDKLPTDIQRICRKAMNDFAAYAPLSHEAILFAAYRHGAQKRKYTNVPYITHPISVARRVMAVTQDSAVIAAAVLHDVLEDTVVTYLELSEYFNAQIADLVMEVTDQSKPQDGNRKTRKEIDRQHLAQASQHGQTIKLADIIDNLSAILKYDPNFAKVYVNEKMRVLNVLTKGDPTLSVQAQKICQDIKRCLMAR